MDDFFPLHVDTYDTELLDPLFYFLHWLSVSRFDANVWKAVRPLIDVPMSSPRLRTMKEDYRIVPRQSTWFAFLNSVQASTDQAQSVANATCPVFQKDRALFTSELPFSFWLSGLSFTGVSELKIKKVHSKSSHVSCRFFVTATFRVLPRTLSKS